MKKLLLTIAMIALVGCGDASADLPSWKSNLTLVKKFDRHNDIFMSPKGNCYLEYYNGNQGSASKVDCEDFGVKVGNHITKENKHATDSSTALLEYIRDFCVVNDEYESFPRVKGTPVIKGLQGKQLSCKLPYNIDNSLNERAEYTRLKNKFEGGQVVLCTQGLLTQVVHFVR